MLISWQMQKWPEFGVHFPRRPARDAWLPVGLHRLLWPLDGGAIRLGPAHLFPDGPMAATYAISLPAWTRQPAFSGIPRNLPARYDWQTDDTPDAHRAGRMWLTGRDHGPAIRSASSGNAPPITRRFGIHPDLREEPEIWRAIMGWFELARCCGLAPVWESRPGLLTPPPEALRSLPTAADLLGLHVAELASTQPSGPEASPYRRAERDWLELTARLLRAPLAGA